MRFHRIDGVLMRLRALASAAGRGDPVHDAVECRRTRLPSGLRIVSEHVPAVRSLAIGVWVDIGSRDERPEENGITHFIEHAVFKGTARRRTHQIAQYLESVGGYVNAFTGKDATCYYARVLDRHLPRAVDLLADLVCHPAFREREVEKEKLVIAEEMRSAEDDPEDIINDYFERRLFGAHPLGAPVIGTQESIGALQAPDLHRFVRSHYTAQNIVVAASGSIDHERLVDLAAAAFADLPSGEPVRRARPRPLRPRIERIEKPVQQTHVMIGRQAPGLRHADSVAISLLNALLGDGMSSRLFQRVRERHGYAYSIYSFANAYEDSSAFGVYFCADSGTVQRCRDIISRELADLRERALPLRELNRAKEQMIGSMLLGLESMNSRMTRLGKDELVYGRIEPFDELIGKIAALTPDDLQRVAGHACDESAYTVTVIEPGGDDGQE